MKQIVIEVSKKENGKHVKVGDVQITVPVLEDIVGVIAAKVTEEKDGLPVYDSDIANWVQDAMLAYVKSDARNKLQPGTVTLKEGAKIPETWEELCATGTRGSGAALALYRDCKNLFATYVATLGKSEKAADVITTLFGNRAALSLQSKVNKDKMAGYVNGFAESLTAEELEKYMRPIESVLAATAEETSDF